ncbi:hypothetical protein BDV10DRAFT_158074 [Aspergillus recurvatus]
MPPVSTLVDVAEPAQAEESRVQREDDKCGDPPSSTYDIVHIRLLPFVLKDDEIDRAARNAVRLLSQPPRPFTPPQTMKVSSIQT